MVETGATSNSASPPAVRIVSRQIEMWVFAVE